MINRNISVHLQDFPDVSFLNDEKELISNMDLVRNICSTALSIRDNKNLRVRLPLKSLTIIGKNSSRISPFKDIISDEVNVKEINFEEDISKFADLKMFLLKVHYDEGSLVTILLMKDIGNLRGVVSIMNLSKET